MPLNDKILAHELGPRKLFVIMPFRSLENAPFLENLPLKEANSHHWWGFSTKNLKKGLQFHKDTYCF